jgi:membrane protease YdiL (CAAX protease family)
MPDEIKDPVAGYFAAGALFLSGAICLVLLVARSQGPLLAFRPRRLVPWNAIGALLACVFVFLVLLSALRPTATSHEANPDGDAGSTIPPVYRLIDQIVAPTMIVGGVFVLIAVYFKPTRCDLGLPASRRELAEDVVLGIIVGLAALAPVILIQALLMSLLGIESGHEIVKLMREGQPNVFMFALATLAVVIIAPISEEITFRLLLQGWLEKWEVEQIQTTNDQCRMTNDELQRKGEPLLAEPQAADESSTTQDVTISESPPLGVAGWPFGWLPITLSSALFGLAHFGYGPEPIPLFLLALALGYVYQRTHRIIPCMVAHAVFNSFTVFMLWRMVFHRA